MKKNISTFYLLVFIIISCSKGDDTPAVLSDENSITSFKLTINNEVLSGIIDQLNKTITFNVEGADLNSLIPTIQYSDRATIFPSENESQNFNQEVDYTVYAENGDIAIYKVIVNNRPLNTENLILSFSVEIEGETVNGEINEGLKTITFNAGDFDISSLIPSISISENASISPEVGSVINFENEVIYTVIAENGDEITYTVYANAPKVNAITTKVGLFTNNPILLYTRADIRIIGQFLNLSLPNTEVYLSDGTNTYNLVVSQIETYNNGLITEYYLSAEIPENVITGNEYKIYFRKESIITESETFIDIVAENSPLPISLNQELYVRGDTMILNGVNLTIEIAIPSNGSLYIVNSQYYNFEVNIDETEIRLLLDNSSARHLFPSYYGNNQEEKIITLLGPNRRAGKTFTTNFD